ncbi:MAG TPA: hypothetical protein VMF08_10410 [Candidatus Sulfotelmatobacter sp.]|nr:hypothetical protein [Candidatus Sulfotelmatobacter sp.]
METKTDKSFPQIPREGFPHRDEFASDEAHHEACVEILNKQHDKIRTDGQHDRAVHEAALRGEQPKAETKS